MAMYVVVLPAMKSGRLDVTMLERIAQIAIQGKPTLICFNQFSRYLDLWANAEEADKACAHILQSVVNVAPVAKDFVQVWLTEFRQFDQQAAQFRARNIKSAEDVSFASDCCLRRHDLQLMQLHTHSCLGADTAFLLRH